MKRWVASLVALVTFAPLGPFSPMTAEAQSSAGEATLDWSELPSLPDELGVAGPFAGVHNGALIVAGGANFPRPVWDNDKRWHDSIHLLVADADGRFVWKDGGTLPRPVAYGAAVSIPQGVVCIGGNDAERTFRDAFLLAYDRGVQQVTIHALPSLPRPCAFSSATLVGNRVYMVGGQRGQTLDTATNDFWSLDLSNLSDTSLNWVDHGSMPGRSRALHITATSGEGPGESVLVISGRREEAGATEFLRDVWQYTPATDVWRQRRDAPRSMMAGVGIGFGKRRVFVLGGADGSLFHRTDELRDEHPGFPKEAFVYDSLTDTWNSAGPTPRNHVTTIATKWNGSIIVPSGEVRPRVRSPKIWKVTPESQD